MTSKKIDEEEAQKKFIKELKNQFAKFDEKIGLGRDAYKCIGVLKNGEPCGYIYNMEVYRERDMWGNAQYKKVDLDHMTVLKSIALVLQRHGVKVFFDRGNLIVVQRHEGGGYDEIECPNIHLLYARSDFFGRVYGSEASVFSDGLQYPGHYRFKNGKLTFKPSRWNFSDPEPEAYEVPEFTETKEEIIKQGKEIKYGLQSR